MRARILAGDTKLGCRHLTRRHGARVDGCVPVLGDRQAEAVGRRQEPTHPGLAKVL